MSIAYNGNYEDSMFNREKRYSVHFQKGVPLASNELDEVQDVCSSYLRQLITSNFPRGSSVNNGFKVIESTDSDRNFTICGGDGTVDGAGVLFVDGYILFLKSNIEYKNQGYNTGSVTDDSYTKTFPTAPVLTTPITSRTDAVYVDFYFAEVSAVGNGTGTLPPEYKDTSLIVPNFGFVTANRLRMVQDVRVLEDYRPLDPDPQYNIPEDGNDSNGIFHRYVKIATIVRNNSNNITQDMITDNRILVNSVSSYSTGDTITDLVLSNHSSIGDDTHRIDTIFMSSDINYGTYLTLSTGVGVNRSEKVIFTNEGNVGIGTSSPVDKLQITGGDASIRNTSPLLKFYGGTGSSVFQGEIGNIGATGMDFYTAGAGASLRFHTLGLQRMLIDSAGNVGINVSNPTHKLQVEGDCLISYDLIIEGSTEMTNLSIAGKLTITQNSNLNGLQVSQTNALSNIPVTFISNSGTGASLIINGTGSNKVGIGTATPGATLHVDGNTIISSNVAIGKNSISPCDDNSRLLEVGSVTAILSNASGVEPSNSVLANNAYFDGAWKPKLNGTSSLYSFGNCSHVWYCNSGLIQDTPFTRVQKMKLDGIGLFIDNLTVDTVVYNNALGYLTSSPVTPIELSYLSGKNSVVDGSGTINKFPVWSAEKRLANSILSTDGNCMLLTPSGVTSSYNDGLRISRSPAGYSLIALGCANDSYSGSQVGQWTMYSEPTAANYKFKLDYNTSTKLIITTSGNFAIDSATVQDWNGYYNAFQIRGETAIASSLNDIGMFFNCYLDSSTTAYKSVIGAGTSMYLAGNGTHSWYANTSVPQNSQFDPTLMMSLDDSGLHLANLNIGYVPAVSGNNILENSIIFTSGARAMINTVTPYDSTTAFTVSGKAHISDQVSVGSNVILLDSSKLLLQNGSIGIGVGNTPEQQIDISGNAIFRTGFQVGVEDNETVSPTSCLVDFIAADQTPLRVWRNTLISSASPLAVFQAKGENWESDLREKRISVIEFYSDGKIETSGSIVAAESIKTSGGIGIHVNPSVFSFGEPGSLELSNIIHFVSNSARISAGTDVSGSTHAASLDVCSGRYVTDGGAIRLFGKDYSDTNKGCVFLMPCSVPGNTSKIVSVGKHSFTQTATFESDAVFQDNVKITTPTGLTALRVRMYAESADPVGNVFEVIGNEYYYDEMPPAHWTWRETVVASIDNVGQIRSDAGTSIITPASDFAEWTTIEGNLNECEVGTLVQQSMNEDMKVSISNKTFDSPVYGVVTNRATFCGGFPVSDIDVSQIKKDFKTLKEEELEIKYNARRIAMKGHVLCKVIGNIKKGDRLVISEINGVAKAASTKEERLEFFAIARQDYDKTCVGLIEVKI